MKIVHIYQGDETLLLHENGHVERTCKGCVVRPSASWQVIGAVERNNFGRVVQRYSLSDIFAAGTEGRPPIPWTYKNGKQRVLIQDLDHGTRREWCSPGYRLGVAVDTGQGVHAHAAAL